MGRKESIFENHLAEAILKSSDSSELSSPNYPGSLQGSEYGSSDDDAGDYPYRNDGEDGTQVVITRTNPSAKKDPGPSVRVRTAAELDAVIKAQVEDASFPGLDTTGLPLLRNFLTAFEQKIRNLLPQRTELDWKNGVPRPVRSAVTRRAAHGQLCGVEAPADQKCTACAQGRANTFENCRIVFVNTEAQWMWACASCIFTGAGHKCSFRPDQSGNVAPWVIAAVAERQPSSPLLQTYYARKDAAATSKPANLTISRKRPAAVAKLNPEQVDQAPELAEHEYTPSRHELPSSTIQPAKETPRVREAAVLKRTPATPKVADKEQPAKRRKSEAGPANASEGTTKDEPKRRKSEVAPAKASEGASKDAPPKLKNGGLPFNATWYNSPLEDPKVYSMKDKDYALDTYNDLADLIARVTEDHGRMKTALLKKGFLLESDEESEEENVFAVD
ncbi:hypothetical protein EN45_048960 [Penicillium chrysogenum]|uniref:Uncharacterized protein n=2 Tax=Penicillium chrysogenum species complex TaxID=254878 RepID=B6HHC4_PENRW|nr:uncharacterized protein N7525_009814 [Penicillium rubens]KAJ5053118.1 hypothetical protein NUH16_010178 [Penicillium rubens]KAJ5831561.1 hypothetical protein N7525_009814 [Penicillium rubens]KZN86373.1 hypothetical protein EN45_048960 [Penicillium chrysogenum]CAP86767.1 hypothetical protein PCH_Pc20g14380 [Penicillium rubens Wisconsin 54-1255]